VNSSCPEGSSPLRSRHRTEQRLKDAIKQLQQAGTKVSISAVAKAADVTPALIHNTYPGIAEQIRTVTGKTARNQGDAKYDALAQERQRNRALRVEVDHLRQECAKLASINLTLMNKPAAGAEQLLERRSGVSLAITPPLNEGDYQVSLVDD